MKSFKIRFIATFLLVTHIFVFTPVVRANEYPNTQLADINKYDRKIFAVADFTNDTGINDLEYLKKALPNSLITSIGKNISSKFSIVERIQLESIIKELGLSNTNFIDSSSAQKIGNMSGATHIILGGLAKAGPVYRLNVRVIEVKTARLVLSLSEDTNSDLELFKLIDKISKDLIEEMDLKEKIASPIINIVPTPSPTIIPEKPKEVKIPEKTDQVQKENGPSFAPQIIVGSILLIFVLSVTIIVASHKFN